MGIWRVWIPGLRGRFSVSSEDSIRRGLMVGRAGRGIWLLVPVSLCCCCCSRCVLFFFFFFPGSLTESLWVVVMIAVGGL